jgi:hypothetical protein
MIPAESAQWAQIAMNGVGNILVAHLLVRLLKLDARAVYSSLHAGLCSFALVLLALWGLARCWPVPLLVLFTYVPVMGWVYRRAYRIEPEGAGAAAYSSAVGVIIVVLLAGWLGGAPY